MTVRCVVHPLHHAKAPAALAGVAAAARVERGPLLGLPPLHPSAISAEAAPPLARGLEAEADAVATTVAGGLSASPSRHPSSAVREAFYPAAAASAVGAAFRSAGKPLDAATRAYMEPRLGADLGEVRVHADESAAAAADALRANAYTIGGDIFFAAGRYRPHTGEGRRLLAHELSHTVQQSGGRPEHGLSKAALGAQRQEAAPAQGAGGSDDKNAKRKQPVQKTVDLPPQLLPHLQLTPPSLLAPPPRQFMPQLQLTPPPLQAPPQQQPPSPPLSFVTGGAGGAASPPAQNLAPVVPGLPSLPPSFGAGGPLVPQPAPNPSLAPTPKSGPAPSAAPAQAPDRVALKDVGPISLGVRFGFPDIFKDVKPGEEPSAFQAAMRQAQIINYHFTGQTPDFLSLDVGKVIGVGYSIFATYIDPAAAAALAAKVSSDPTKGPRIYLDATVLLKTSQPNPGGGAGLTLTYIF